MQAMASRNPHHLAVAPPGRSKFVEGFATGSVSPPPGRSRFTEGSMNDRVSAVPPPHFLGPETFCDPDHQYAHSTTSASSDPVAFPFSFNSSDPARQHGGAGASDNLVRPRSAGASMPTRDAKRGFFAPLWEGFREKLHFGKKRPLSLDGARLAVGPMHGNYCQQQQHQAPLGAGASHQSATEPIDIAGNRPTKEEVMANYQQLLESGFFGAHAIVSTRQPPPGSLLSTSLPSQKSHPHGPSSYMKPQLPTIYSPPRNRTSRPEPTTPERQTLRGVPLTPDSRGKKRTYDDQNENETGGVMARKLRKTTRSIADFHLARIKRQRPAEADTRADTTATTAGSSILSSPEDGIMRAAAGVFVRRTFSGSSQSNKLAKRPTTSGGSRPPSSRGVGRDQSRERVAISGPVTPVVKLQPGVFDSMHAEGSRARKVSGGSHVSMNTRSRTAALLAHKIPAFPSSSSQGYGQGGSRGRDSQREFPLQCGGRKEGLSVRPNANRGIPSVPAIPSRYKELSPGSRGGEN